MQIPVYGICFDWLSWAIARNKSFMITLPWSDIFYRISRMSEAIGGIKRGIYVGSVVRNVQLCDEHYLLCISLQDFPPSKPGQFVQLLCRGLDQQISAREIAWVDGSWPQASQAELTNREPMLRRPISLAGRRDLDGGSVEIDMIYRIIGAGTRWLSGISAGQKLSVLGPLGNGFTIRPEKPFAALIGGGVGIPPMLYLASALNSAGVSSAAFLGVRSSSLLPVTIIDQAEPAADGRPTPCVREFNFTAPTPQ
jgi:hypothetical protein